jgi:diguanylate cyclase (GGDEF)-like protein/PAS domain S-box-containing protein
VLAGTAVWSLASGLEIVAPTVASKIFWIRIQYVGVAFLPPSWILFALEYSGRRSRLLPGRLAAALYAVPGATWLLVLTSPRHAWMWESVRLPPGGFGELATERGAWFWAVHVPYSWSLVVAGVVLLLLPGAEGAARDRPRRLLGLAAVPPFLANAAYVLGGSRFLPGDFTPLGFAVTGVMVAWGLARERLFGLAPAAHRAVFDAIGDAVYVVDAEDRIVDLNRAAEQRLGRSRWKVIGGKAAQVFERWSDLIARYRDREGEVREELAFETEGGRRVVELLIFPLHGRGRRRIGRVAISRDVSERHAYQAQIEHLAFHDSLTGLPNRRWFEVTVEKALALAGRKGWGAAALFLDLDGFKAVNDALGHAMGDQLLQQVAERLRAATRGGSLLARIGGDEFALLLQDCDEAGARTAAHRLLDALHQAFGLGERAVYVEASLGMALHPQHGATVDELLTRADVAMYQAKRAGQRIAVYDPEADVYTQEQLQLEGDLHRALQNDELELHYQPILDLARRKIGAVEALLRWPHPTRGLLLPGQFLPLAEERGLAGAVDRWVLRRALRDWRSGSVEVAINLFPQTLLDPELPGLLEEEIERFHLRPSRLTLEITETALPAPERAGRVLAQLKHLGVRVVADDFGAGYSLLSYLRHFPLDGLKLHEQVIGGIGTHAADEAILEAVLLIASRTGLDVVAEGVESSAQLDWLRARRCPRVQGMFVGAPVPLATLRRERPELFAPSSPPSRRPVPVS